MHNCVNGHYELIGIKQHHIDAASDVTIVNKACTSWTLVPLAHEDCPKFKSITHNNSCVEFCTSWTLGVLDTRLLPQVQVQVVKKNLWCSGSRDRYDLVTFCLSSSSYDSMQPLWSGIYHFMTNIIIFIINCVAYLRPVVLPPSNSPKQQRPGRILLEIRSLPPT